MYNAERKREFIREFTDKVTTVKYAYDLFESLGKFEEEMDADICTMPADTVRPVVEKYCGVRSRSKQKPLYILRGYAEWCVKNDVPGACLDLLEISGVSADKIRTKMVRLPSQLQSYLDTVFEPEADETIDNTYRAFFWLTFSGMDDDDIMNVTEDEIDLRHMCVRHGGKDYPLYAEGVPAVMNAATLTQFQRKNPTYISGGVYKDRVPGKNIMRGVLSMPTIDDVRTFISRKQRAARNAGKTGMDLKPYSVRMSGMFYRKWIAEQNNMPVDFMAEAREAAGDRIYKLDTSRLSQEGKRREIARQLEDDYRIWKFAFSESRSGSEPGLREPGRQKGSKDSYKRAPRKKSEEA